MFGSNLWDFLIYSIPWPVQVLLLAVPAVVILYFVYRIVGWNRIKGWVPAVVAAIVALGLLSSQRQKGYADRKTQEQDALKKAEVIVEKKRDEVKAMPNTKLDKEVDRWSRP
jgi:hypothetical protein